MSKFFTTVQDFLAKFNTVQWTGVDGDSVIGKLPTGDTVEFSLDTRFATNSNDMDSMPVQVIARVLINDVVASTWGAGDSKDCTELVKFFVEADRKAMSMEHAIEKSARAQAESKWDAL